MRARAVDANQGGEDDDDEDEGGDKTVVDPTGSDAPSAPPTPAPVQMVPSADLNVAPTVPAQPIAPVIAQPSVLAIAPPIPAFEPALQATRPGEAHHITQPAPRAAFVDLTVPTPPRAQSLSYRDLYFPIHQRAPPGFVDLTEETPREVRAAPGDLAEQLTPRALPALLPINYDQAVDRARRASRGLPVEPTPFAADHRPMDKQCCICFDDLAGVDDVVTQRCCGKHTSLSLAHSVANIGRHRHVPYLPPHVVW